MLQPNQIVYYTSGPVVQEAIFDHYSGKSCVLRTSFGLLTQRAGRVFTETEAREKGLLKNNVG